MGVDTGQKRETKRHHQRVVTGVGSKILCKITKIELYNRRANIIKQLILQRHQYYLKPDEVGNSKDVQTQTRVKQKKKIYFSRMISHHSTKCLPHLLSKKKKKRKTCLLAHFLFAILVNSLSLTPMFRCSRHQSGCYEIYIWMLGIKTTKTLN